MDPLKLLQELVEIPGPPGQEQAVNAALARHVEGMGLGHRSDAKGNLLVGSKKPKLVVTAHMDEIALIVRGFDSFGRLIVGPLGGVFPWKLGEGPVQVLCAEPLDAVLSFGSIHTGDKASNVRRVEHSGLDWEMARVITGLGMADMIRKGVRPGTRIVVHPSRRKVMRLGHQVASYFLDDRADLVAWLLALQELKEMDGVLFAATAAEEVGGEGALYILHELRPEVCIALELGPHASDSPIEISDQPTVWASDSYSSMAAEDGDLIAGLGARLGLHLQFQAVSRGGSDASCAASNGLCARPFTLGLPMENSHGFEIMHSGAIPKLAALTCALVRELVGQSPA